MRRIPLSILVAISTAALVGALSLALARPLALGMGAMDESTAMLLASVVFGAFALLLELTSGVAVFRCCELLEARNWLRWYAEVDKVESEIEALSKQKQHLENALNACIGDRS
jgi:hypothetical protein